MNKIGTILSLCSLTVVLAGFTMWKRSGRTKPDLNLLKNADNIVPVAVIGSGPTGLSAALFTARASPQNNYGFI